MNRHMNLNNLEHIMMPYCHTKFEKVQIIIANNEPLAKAIAKMTIISKGVNVKASALRFGTSVAKLMSFSPAHRSISKDLVNMQVIIEFIHILGCKKRRHTNRKSKHHLQNHQKHNTPSSKSNLKITFHFIETT